MSETGGCSQSVSHSVRQAVRSEERKQKKEKKVFFEKTKAFFDCVLLRRKRERGIKNGKNLKRGTRLVASVALSIESISLSLSSF